jgi:hypothetical protein
MKTDRLIFALLIVSLITLAACATSERLVWEHPQRSSRNFNADVSTCEAESYQSLPSHSPPGAPQFDLNSFNAGADRARAENARDARFNVCMRKQGWRLMNVRE